LNFWGLDVLDHNALFIEREVVIGTEFGDQRTIKHDLFLNICYSWVEVVASKIVAFFDLSDTWALRVVFARITLGPSLVRCAFFRCKMTIFSQVSIKYSKSTFTSLSHVITHEHKLW
jgi:hypothetical protein